MYCICIFTHYVCVYIYIYMYTEYYVKGMCMYIYPYTSIYTINLEMHGFSAHDSLKQILGFNDAWAKLHEDS